jgi:hypothetical protein
MNKKYFSVHFSKIGEIFFTALAAQTDQKAEFRTKRSFLIQDRVYLALTWSSIYYIKIYWHTGSDQ